MSRGLTSVLGKLSWIVMLLYRLLNRSFQVLPHVLDVSYSNGHLSRTLTLEHGLFSTCRLWIFRSCNAITDARHEKELLDPKEEHGLD